MPKIRLKRVPGALLRQLIERTEEREISRDLFGFGHPFRQLHPAKKDALEDEIVRGVYEM